MSTWVGMAVPFVVGLAGGAGIAYALSSGSGKSSAPAAPAAPSFEEKQAAADELNNNPAYNRFINGAFKEKPNDMNNNTSAKDLFSGGKRRRTRRGGKKRGHKKTSRR